MLVRWGKDKEERATYSGREYLLVVNVVLHPGHEVLNVFRSRHLCRSFVLVLVLPEVFEPTPVRLLAQLHRQRRGGGRKKETSGIAYSSVAFISGQVTGEQNSVIDPYYPTLTD